MILLSASCITSKLKPIEESFNVTQILNDTSKSYIYRTDIQIFDTEFSGMTVFKPQKGSYRIVFLNEIGMKFFDFELFEDSFQIRQIFEAMNKKMFVNILIEDYRLMIDYPRTKQPAVFYDEQTGEKVVKPKGMRDFYYYNPETCMPIKKSRYSPFRKIVDLSYSEYNDCIPYKINIQHQNIKFGMHMSFIK